jgi:hypothetical protein
VKGAVVAERTRDVLNALMPDRAKLADDDTPDAARAVAPSRWLQSREWFTLVEYVATRLSGDLIARCPRGDGHPVLVIPGFLGGHRSTDLLRKVLRELGYQPLDWGLGWNLGYRSNMLADLSAAVKRMRIVVNA